MAEIGPGLRRDGAQLENKGQSRINHLDAALRALGKRIGIVIEAA